MPCNLFNGAITSGLPLPAPVLSPTRAKVGPETIQPLAKEAAAPPKVIKP